MWLRCTSRTERHEVNPGSQGGGDLGSARARGAADSWARCREVVHAGAGAPHSLPAPSPGRPREGRGVPLAPGSGGLAMMHRACRGHGGSQPGLRMVKCGDVERRQWGAPGAWGLEEASEKTWIMASLSIWLLLSPPAMPTAHFWDLLSEGCLWIPDSRSGPCLAQRPVKGCGAINRRLDWKRWGGRSAGPTRPAGSWSSFSL